VLLKRHDDSDCRRYMGRPIAQRLLKSVEGTAIQKEAAFVLATRYLKNRISIFISLPIRSLDKMALNVKLREIGQLEGATKPRPAVA